MCGYDIRKHAGAAAADRHGTYYIYSRTDRTDDRPPAIATDDDEDDDARRMPTAPTY
jgi:hypothetical protein